MFILCFKADFYAFFARQSGQTAYFATKVLQKMHIRKKTNIFLEKKIDLSIY